MGDLQGEESPKLIPDARMKILAGKHIYNFLERLHGFIKLRKSNLVALIDVESDG